MAPINSYQLYTIHGLFRGDGMPLVWAILPNKTKATYVELFTVTRDPLLARFGHLGVSRTFLIDFEAASIEAVTETFSDSTVKGCTFHFAQALLRRVNDEGLRAVYNASRPPEIRKWIREITALCLLPVVLIPYAWSILKHPPAVDDDSLIWRMQNFSEYVERTWINGCFPPTLWSHFDNVGPRTTNIAEGWHNSLNHDLGMCHPSYRNFLHWLQRCQFTVQCRRLQILGGQPPKKRSHIYQEMDSKITEAKVNLVAFLNSSPLIGSDVFDHTIGHYLRRVSYFLSGGVILKTMPDKSHELYEKLYTTILL